MDVINLSLGSDGEKDPNSPDAIAINNAVLSGVRSGHRERQRSRQRQLLLLQRFPGIFAAGDLRRCSDFLEPPLHRRTQPTP